MAMETTRALGRGLSSLIAERPELENVVVKRMEDQGVGVNDILLSEIVPGGGQPRHHFDEKGLQELASSIAKSGVVQPVLLRKLEKGYEIIAGERRVRASKLAGKTTVPAIVREVDDKEAFEIALIENIQRQDLSPIEVAEGYQRLLREFSYTQEQLSEVVGKSRSAVTNQLRLLTLPDSVKAYMDEGKISTGHAKVLLAADDVAWAADEVVRLGLNVRQTEALLKQGKKAAPIRVKKSQIVEELEKNLAKKIGTKVTVKDEGGKGSLTIHYGTPEVLNEVVKKLS